MRALLLAGVVAAGWTGAARAGVIEYTSQSAFDAAAPGLTVQMFSGASGTATYVSEPDPYTYGSLTFTTNTDQINLFNNGDYGSSVQYVGIDPETIPTAVNITLPAGITAIAFDLGTFTGTDRDVGVSINGIPQSPLVTTGGHPSTTFLGLTDTDAITSVSLNLFNYDELDFTAFQVGTATPATAVPEPATLALLGLPLGLLGLVTLRWGRGVSAAA